MLNHCENFKKKSGTPMIHESKAIIGMKYTLNKIEPSIFSISLRLLLKTFSEYLKKHCI